MKTGIELIAQERQERIEKHEKTINYDILNNPHRKIRDVVSELISDCPKLDNFPVDWQGTIMEHAISKSYKERLIISGALIAAEIDRIQCRHDA